MIDKLENELLDEFGHDLWDDLWHELGLEFGWGLWYELWELKDEFDDMEVVYD